MRRQPDITERGFFTTLKFDSKGLFLLIFLLSGIYIFVFGDSGILERRSLSAEREYLAGMNSALAEENQKFRDIMENHKNLLISSERNNFLYIKQGQKLVVFDMVNSLKDQVPRHVEKKEKVVFIRNLRVIWLVMSLLCVIFYFMKMRSGEKNAV